MEHQFWHNKWQAMEIGFHEKQANPLLVKHIDKLELSAGSRILVPLCGKTLDIHWLLDKGYQVVAVELVKDAIEQLFAELGVQPEIHQDGQLLHYSATNIDVFVGDIFNLTQQQLGNVDAIYDRAALVALPQSMRSEYSEQLTHLTNAAKQLLIVFDYDQQLVAGPPFSIPAKAVEQHYQQHYQITLLDDLALQGGLKGRCPAQEQVWLLQPKG